jgi:hypothetical protein
MFRTVHRRGRRALAVTSALLLSAVPVPAQDKPSEPPKRPGEVVATEQVEVLTLDVLAVDGKNRPVFGLTAADFEVKVAGKVQQIDSFEAPPARVPRPAAGSHEGRSDSEERIAGTTTPFASEGRSVRHVLFYVDLEELPKRSIYESAEAIRKALEHPAAGRYGLTAHLGRASSRVWDTDAPDALLSEADALAAEASTGETSSASVSRIREPGGGASSDVDASPSSYEERKQLEKRLIDELLNAEESANGNPGVTRPYEQAIARYLQAERRRVKLSVEELRATCERFAGLEGPRHVVLVTEGYERVPGINFLNRLQLERQIRRIGGNAEPPPLSRRNVPAGLPGAVSQGDQGRFAFNASPLREIDDLVRWIGATGIALHYLDPGSAFKDMPSADDRSRLEPDARRLELRNLEDAPLRLADTTGGLSRIATANVGAAVEGLLDATTATYHLTMRLVGVDTKKTYSVKVSVKKSGVTALARSAFQPGAKKRQVPAAFAADARHASLAAAADERRPGAARTAKKPIPVVLSWKGLSTLDSKDPAKPFWKLDVKIPHEALTFKPEEDAMLASVQISVEASALDGPLRDSFTDDWFLSYTGPEYREARDLEAVRSITLQLPPGRWELKVSVHDALGDAFGAATVRVDAAR